jgi:hypothetical protein
VQGRAITTRFGSPPFVGALALAGALAGTGAPAAGAAPRGRVVRVERASATPTPRLCIMGHGRDAHLCLGQARAGERIALLVATEPRLRGELVIESATDATDLRRDNVCISGGAQYVKGWYTSGTDSSDVTAGLRGAGLDLSVARVLDGVPAPSGHADESVKLAVDGDGNGSADLVMTAYRCTPDGAPAPSGASSDSRCFDTYMAYRGKLRRVHQDIIRACR